MAEKVQIQPDSMFNLDDLLQCPVCYEIPTGQIFQCNEGHHVCGRCKARLDVCPVCRALFFGTRNYAMEELIANFRKLRSFKLGGKITAGSGSSESSTPAHDTGSGDTENDTGEEEENNVNVPNQITLRAPQACKGLFRCLCCKNGNAERLPAARLLNHLRYFHSPDLIEGQSENGEYLQAWQFLTVPGRIVTAVRISDMGIFFLIIEITSETVYAWLTMAASPWVTNKFSYTITISGNDREAIFSDCVWSVRSCEGALKKRGHSLVVSGLDAVALTAPVSISGKLSLRHTPADQLVNQTQPRAVLRVATRGNTHDNLLQDLQNNVARLSRAVASLEANGIHSESENRTRIEIVPEVTPISAENFTADDEIESQMLSDSQNEAVALSRNARRRMRRRLRAALNVAPATDAPRSSLPTQSHGRQPNSQRQNGYIHNNTTQHQPTQPPPTPTVAPAAQSSLTNGPSTSTDNTQNSNQARNKKKRRLRR